MHYRLEKFSCRQHVFINVPREIISLTRLLESSSSADVYYHSEGEKSLVLGVAND